MNLLRTTALAAALLAGAATANADELRLDDAQLDAVSAGFVNMPFGNFGGMNGFLPQLPIGDHAGDISLRLLVLKSVLINELKLWPTPATPAP